MSLQPMASSRPNSTPAAAPQLDIIPEHARDRANLEACIRLTTQAAEEYRKGLIEHALQTGSLLIEACRVCFGKDAPMVAQAILQRENMACAILKADSDKMLSAQMIAAACERQMVLLSACREVHREATLLRFRAHLYQPQPGAINGVAYGQDAALLSLIGLELDANRRGSDQLLMIFAGLDRAEYYYVRGNLAKARTEFLSFLPRLERSSEVRDGLHTESFVRYCRIYSEVLFESESFREAVFWSNKARATIAQRNPPLSSHEILLLKTNSWAAEIHIGNPYNVSTETLERFRQQSPALPETHPWSVRGLCLQLLGELCLVMSDHRRARAALQSLKAGAQRCADEFASKIQCGASPIDVAKIFLVTATVHCRALPLEVDPNERALTRGVWRSYAVRARGLFEQHLGEDHFLTLKASALAALAEVNPERTSQEAEVRAYFALSPIVGKLKENLGPSHQLTIEVERFLRGVDRNTRISSTRDDGEIDTSGGTDLDNPPPGFKDKY